MADDKRRKLWDALNKLVHQEGGWITSVPGVPYIRLECLRGSSLPAKLSEIGFSPRYVGVSTRLVPGGTIKTTTEHSTGMPLTRRHTGFVPIDIVEITLPET
jgi:hypothetical protein